MAQLVAHLHGMEGVGGSNPPSSTTRTLILIQSERPFFVLRAGVFWLVSVGFCVLLARSLGSARVSTEHDRQLSSIAAQVSHYSHLIQSIPAWEYAGVFIDEGITGTTTKNREGFNDLMNAARVGHIDVILTKSISRFARNTLDLLQAIRELKTLGVGVRFERENIDTTTADGELLLTLLASFAQEESRSISKNVKWGIRKKYADGQLHSRQPYGYRYVEGELRIIEREAAVVKQLFNDFLAGISPEKTAARLNAQGIKPRRANKFQGKTLRKMLENEIYAGNALLQKTYRPQIANTASKPNQGELPRFILENCHEAIIDLRTFNAVQAELAKRREHGRAASPGASTNALTSHIVCSLCGRKYHRRTKNRGGRSMKIWWCETATKGKGNPCQAPQLQETILKTICLELLGLKEWDDAQLLTRLDEITVSPDRILTFTLKNQNQTLVVDLTEWRKINECHRNSAA